MHLRDDSYLFFHLGSYEYPYYRGKLRVLFEKYLIESRLVLDVGCGPKGRYFSNLPEGTWGIGLDINRKNVVKAKKANTSNNVSFIMGSMENLPFIENLFDLIICCDALEHVREANKAVKELVFTLRKRGRLFISTTNLFNPAMLIDTLLPKIVSGKIIKRFGGPSFYEREYRFNKWNLVKKLRQYGLLVHLDMFGNPPMGATWLYQFSRFRLPSVYYLWIAFDKLTNTKVLRGFKEIMVASVEKK